jgi:hypothetical protein
MFSPSTARIRTSGSSCSSSVAKTYVHLFLDTPNAAAGRHRQVPAKGLHRQRLFTVSPARSRNPSRDDNGVLYRPTSTPTPFSAITSSDRQVLSTKVRRRCGRKRSGRTRRHQVLSMMARRHGLHTAALRMTVVDVGPRRRKISTSRSQGSVAHVSACITSLGN